MSREIIDGKYNIRYLPTQSKVLAAASDFIPNIMYCGGFGSGKTRIAGEIGWEFACQFPGIEIAYFRKTRVSIVDTTYKTFLRDVAPPEYLNEKKNRISKLYLEAANRSSFQFFGIDNFLRKGSLEFDIIVIDEGIEIEEEDYYMLQGRLRGKHIKVPLFIIMTNAGAPGSFLYNHFVVNERKLDKKDPDYAYFAADSFENKHNPPAYFARLRKWKGTPYYKRFVKSEWTSFEGIVFSPYDPDIHLIKPFKIPDEWPKYIVIDFGYEHPLAVLWIAEDPVYEISYVYRQFYKVRTLLRKAVKICKEHTYEKIDSIIADHDAENRAQLDEYWMNSIPADKAVMVGLQYTIEAFLERPDKKRSLYIFNDDWSNKEGFHYGVFDRDLLLMESRQPTCLQEEIPKYKWGNDDKPKKEYDHACDGLRYYKKTRQRMKDDQGNGVFVSKSRRSYSRR